MVYLRGGETSNVNDRDPRRTVVALFAGAFVLFLIVTALMFRHEIEGIRSAKADRASQVREIPDFRLTDQAGKEVRRRDLVGNVWIAGLVSTSEGETATVEAMEKIVERLATVPGFRAVLVTTRPELDTAEHLAKYVAARPHPHVWVALTGEPARVADLARIGLGAAVRFVEDVPRIEGGDAVGIVDRKGRLRATLDVNEDRFVEGALTAIKHALAER